MSTLGHQLRSCARRMDHFTSRRHVTFAVSMVVQGAHLTTRPTLKIETQLQDGWAKKSFCAELLKFTAKSMTTGKQ